MEEAVGIIQKEIDWSRKNAGNNPSEFRLGFIRGLEQAKALIGAFIKEDKLIIGGDYGNEIKTPDLDITIRSPYGDTIGKVNAG